MKIFAKVAENGDKIIYFIPENDIDAELKAFDKMFGFTGWPPVPFSNRGEEIKKGTLILAEVTGHETHRWITVFNEPYPFPEDSIEKLRG